MPRRGTKLAVNTRKGSQNAADIIKRSVVWDNHSCLPLRTDSRFLPQLERYRDAGVNVVSINVGFGQQSLLEHLRVLSFMRCWISQHPDKYQLVESVEDVRMCKDSNTLGIVFDVEGMCPVQEDPSFVQTFYELGVRWMLIAYNHSNMAGGGCQGEDGGLTTLGKSLIDEMERVGMVLCLSHTGARTAAEALEYSRQPVIFSHSNPLGMVSHRRNVSDKLMQACAAKGGVIGLTGFDPFLGAAEALVSRLLDHLRYVIERVGFKHVGLGLDYVFDKDELMQWQKSSRSLAEWQSKHGIVKMVPPEALHEIIEGLIRYGLSDDQILDVLGGNWLRVASRVWR